MVQKGSWAGFQNSLIFVMKYIFYNDLSLIIWFPETFQFPPLLLKIEKGKLRKQAFTTPLTKNYSTFRSVPRQVEDISGDEWKGEGEGAAPVAGPHLQLLEQQDVLLHGAYQRTGRSIIKMIIKVILIIRILMIIVIIINK